MVTTQSNLELISRLVSLVVQMKVRDECRILSEDEDRLNL